MDHATKASFWDQHGPLIQLAGSFIVLLCGIIVFVFQTFSTKEQLSHDVNAIAAGYESTTRDLKKYYDHRLDRLELKLDRIEDKLDQMRGRH